MNNQTKTLLTGAASLTTLFVGFQLATTYPKVELETDREAVTCMRQLDTVCHSTKVRGRSVFWVGILLMGIGGSFTYLKGAATFGLLKGEEDRGESKEDNFHYIPTREEDASAPLGSEQESEQERRKYEESPYEPANQDLFPETTFDEKTVSEYSPKK